MFEDYYEKALNSERPKYGTMNFFNDPRGIILETSRLF